MFFLDYFLPLVIIAFYIGVPAVVIYFIVLCHKMVELTKEKNKKLQRIADTLSDIRDNKSVDR
ncbi:hypothetical protein [Marinilactibacillus kalidii]|uniref:hypothetical protein n=1 Tax=Marinilactibacillus kalidii TaxID=2820274 RepID=UPI001ABE1EAC|nr:hypothetical protein [Marinilactibacillus kalidii]